MNYKRNQKKREKKKKNVKKRPSFPSPKLKIIIHQLQMHNQMRTLA
jgi:hypothetical protein